MKASQNQEQAYLPIEDHAVIGNLETIALVGIDGSIDFMCFPDFDSPSIFARLLDAEQGGYFQIAPLESGMTRKQMYLPDTNILITRFLSPTGILELTDFMPLCQECGGRQLIRSAKCIQGELEVAMTCAPAFDYARARTKAEQQSARRIRFSGNQGEVPESCLHSSIEMTAEDGAARARFVLVQGDSASFSYVCDACEETTDFALDADSIDKVLNKTAHFWRDWLAQSNYQGLWQSQVHRSALVLKLLFSKRHGSMVAAPTFGLPEAIGGGRNWDYRYCWIRDSAFTIYALLKLGFKAEARHYGDWISERYRHCDSEGSLKLMYALDGGSDLEEQTLEHLSGYRDSQPVRIGNGAHDQLQLDIYGELIDSVYLAHKYSSPLSWEDWNQLTRTVQYVQDNWQKEDEGIWEVRGGTRHFLHSRLMCWVALDRAIRLSMKSSYPAPLEEWRHTRDAIYHDIHAHFWNPEVEAFVQHRGSSQMDASVLLMPLVKFISPVDPRWLKTLDAVKSQLVTDAFVKRYTVDPSLEAIDDSEEGSFTMCSFWYCECLARAGRVDEARLLFEKILGYANHVGLYAEELGAHGEHLGNFPQAFTHLALISAAISIDRALSGV